jgi:metallo-beta-lactamase family protein
MKISFHGAARNVTGSCHLLECAGKRLLIDCGLYQGQREITAENSEEFGFAPESIDYLLLSHAHLDHCGRIPLLVRQGFKGEIITTSATRELARLVMLDSAGLQEEDARYRKRRALRRGKETADIHPLYTTLDALNATDFFGRKASYDKPIQLSQGIKVTFIEAGHILGSASILVELEDKNKHRRLLFSGDLGFPGRAILRDPAEPPQVDVVIMESTYGDRQHKLLQPSIEELYEAINTTHARGGNVIIPTFALERTQEILYYLREGCEKGYLKKHLPVFLDSPMAISATEIFRRHPECYDENSAQVLKSGKDPFDLPNLHFTRETSESMAINQITGGAVIMAGSGMCTGGRVVHHLRYNLGRSKSSVVFVGFAARGTLGRRIIDGAETVKIYGEEIRVKAEIFTIGGFSAHADQQGLLSWHKKTGNPKTTYIVHGEERAMEALAPLLTSTDVVMPELHQSFEL